ncbi:MAG: hypothetical protein GY861_13530, partial [bacterium]|nr:hypothetical protein [bacterium]
DTGAQVCFVTERFAKMLEPTVKGAKYKFIRIGHKKRQIEAYERKYCPLPVTLADHSVSTFNEYLPNVLISYQGQKIAENMWICPDSVGEDISLSKSAMHGLGFQLITASGQKVWDVNGNPTAEVEVDDCEDTSCESEDEESIEEDLKIQNRRKPITWSQTPELYVRRVDITKRHSIPGWHAAILQFPIKDLKIKKGKTYALDPNE